MLRTTTMALVMTTALISCAPKPAADSDAQLRAALVASAGAPHPVAIDRELMIVSPRVVDDARATSGVWSFGHLMTQMATKDTEAPALVKAWLRTWEQDQRVNDVPLAKRPSIRSVIIDAWMKKDKATSFDKWTPNLKNAPFRLLAIVYRPDLARRSGAKAILNGGEGRFVFEALGSGGQPLPFTVIFEYGLPAKTNGDITAWAQRWHTLGEVPFGPAYNTALQKVTDSFSKRGSDPAKPNGNALNQLRTNEIALTAPWELREFHLTTAGLTNVVVQQNPHKAVDQGKLSALLNANAATVLQGRFILAEGFADGTPILGGSAEVPFGFSWPKMQISDNNVRQKFAVDTCNGCHHVETGGKPDPGGFRHIGSRKVGAAAGLSGFLTGTTVQDPVDPATPRRFADLDERRKALEQALVVQTRVTATTLEDDQLTVALSRTSRPD